MQYFSLTYYRKSSNTHCAIYSLPFDSNCLDRLGIHNQSHFSLMHFDKFDSNRMTTNEAGALTLPYGFL